MFELLCRVPTIIERDALIVALTSEDIDVVSPDRDVMVKLGSEPSLYLGSASALFEGYDVRVRAADLPRAKDVLAKFRRQHEISLHEENVPEAGVLDAAGVRFLACSLYSVAIPVVFNAVALYWFFRSRNVLSLRPVLTVLALVWNVAFPAGLALLLLNTANVLKLF